MGWMIGVRRGRSLVRGSVLNQIFVLMVATPMVQAAPPSAAEALAFESISTDSQGIPMELPIQVRTVEVRIRETGSPDMPEEDVYSMMGNGRLVFRLDPHGGAKSKYMAGEILEGQSRNSKGEAPLIPKQALRHYLACKQKILGAPLMVEIEDGLFAFAWDQGLILDYRGTTTRYYVALHTLEIDPESPPAGPYTIRQRTIEVPLEQWENRLLPLPNAREIASRGLDAPFFLEVPGTKRVRVVSLSDIDFPLTLRSTDIPKLLTGIRTWAANREIFDGKTQQALVQEVPVFLLRMTHAEHAKTLATSSTEWSLAAMADTTFRTETAPIHVAESNLQFLELHDLMNRDPYRIVNTLPAECRTLIVVGGSK